MKNIILILIVTVVLPCALLADGKVFPMPTIKKAPDIPTQRAIMVYEDGTERLIIESSIDGEGKEFGWIIPLPNKPFEFEAMSPGLIDTFSSTIQPKIKTSVAVANTAIVISILILLWFILRWFCGANTLVIVASLIFGFLLPLFFMMPTLGIKTVKKSIESISGIDILNTAEVGSYGLTTLTADKPDSLDEWLSINGYETLDEKDKAIVADYIKDDWCFVAARLKRNGDGFSRPHPLSMTFESDTAVYPMKLTSTASQNLYLELFIVTDKSAKTDNLVLEFSDKFNFIDDKNTYPDEKEIIFSKKGYEAQKYDSTSLGHPEILNVMWDGCVVSRLCGTLNPNQMKSDIVVKFDDFIPYQKTYYSKDAAIRIVGQAGAISLGTLILFASIKYNKRRGDKKFAFKKIILPSFAISFLFACVCYCVVEKADTQISYMNSPFFRHIYTRSISSFLVGFTEQNKNSFDGQDYDTIVDTVKIIFEEINLQKDYLPEYLSKKPEYGNSPGQFEVIQNETAILLRAYLPGGFTADTIISKTSMQ